MGAISRNDGGCMTFKSICERLDRQHAAGQRDEMLVSVRALAMIRLRGDEDAAQDVVIKVLAGLESSNPIISISRWVNIIITNAKCEIGANASVARNHESLDGDIVDSWKSTYQFPDLSKISNPFIRLVAEKLSQGYTLSEVADMLGVPIANMKKRVQRYRDAVAGS